MHTKIKQLQKKIKDLHIPVGIASKEIGIDKSTYYEWLRGYYPNGRNLEKIQGFLKKHSDKHSLTLTNKDREFLNEYKKVYKLTNLQLSRKIGVSTTALKNFFKKDVKQQAKILKKIAIFIKEKKKITNNKELGWKTKLKTFLKPLLSWYKK